MFDVKLEAVAELDDRRSRRFASLLQQETADCTGRPLPVLLHDLSTTTFLLETSAAFELGTMITINLPGFGPSEGEITWASSRFCGGNLLVPLPAEAVRALLRDHHAVGAEPAQQEAVADPEPATAEVSRSSTTIPFNRASLVGDEIDFLRDSIRRGQLSGDGYYTKQCNASIQQITASQKALITHSCTAALEMAAILCDLAPGDEVIVPSFTFVSTANAIVMRGATPVFVDIDPRTLNLAPAHVEAAVTPRTKAIFAVHYAGFPADMDALRHIADQHGLILIEDAAQALGSTYKGRPAGSLGDLAAFSFHETKNVVSGEGGALTINQPKLIQRAEIIREKGTDRSKFLRGEVDKYTWVDIGSSYLPGELVASFLLAQLKMEPVIRERRLAIFDYYIEALGALAAEGLVRLPVVPDDCTGNGHMFYLMMRSSDQRNAFIAFMKSRGIIAPFHYVPLHSAPGGIRFGRSAGPMTETDRVSDTLVRLPLFYDMGSMVEEVCDCVNEFFGMNTREALH
jgi:dTDP-4-amino-4,6-dideoxygalactose transaminase